ncbi:flavodoxin-dependent (E)-4-hydroxy-3-methylbut-2-enyl-diphosphate synthase [Serpentinicella sp. ANB-PHB4]|uniref:flavodoxin-dependent (E)-4-hydroxy-3-methylbut-2-enyl-diphosphate synthase n=1 Tax=Serpentinicella sp. ANB-PHB4 TaxID=3074076 RepID=UPI002F3E45C6
MRKKTKEIKCGDVLIGSTNPISVQSMTTTDTNDVESTVNQILRLEEASCDIVRIAVPNFDAAQSIKKIKQKTSIPIVADIHFDHRLALEAIKNGVDALRINPGNIGEESKVKELVLSAKAHNIPIRIGVNAGSLDKDLLNKYTSVTAEALVESALRHVEILEDLGFYNTVISLKASNIKLTVDAYNLISKQVDYPLHVGITEAGTLYSGTIKSAIGIGTLLLNGIGDTIRVSLTGDPVEEVKVGREILKSLNLLENEVTIISCPTCGRCEINLIELANTIENKINHIKKPLKIAVMGCAVNGPGEAREADIGIAGGVNSALLFKKGKIIKKIPEKDIVMTLIEEIEKF